MIWESTDAPDLLCKLHGLRAAVAGICGGTHALARSSLLDRAQHTSNNESFLVVNCSGYQGEDFYTESTSVVSDCKVITAPETALASFTAVVFAAAGLSVDTVFQFRAMMAGDHI